MTARPSAKPGDMDVISRAARRIHIAIALGLGVLAVLLWQHVTPSEAAQEAVDPVMVAACKLPAYEGEMTVFVVEGGRLKCWRWR